MYKTIVKSGEAEYIDRRSRFVSAVMPVSNEQEALDFIAKRKSKFWDARHNVYAYSLREGNCRRYSDDGEPQGTAGVPTLDVLTKSEVTDVCVVTTRYFGGVLLGTGGLVRAYSHSVSLALENAGIVTMCPVIDCELRCEYFLYGKLDALLSSFEVLDKECDFAEGVHITFAVKKDLAQALEAAVVDATAGQVRLIQNGEHFAAVSN